MIRESYAAGEVIFEKSDTTESVWLIQKGHVSIFFDGYRMPIDFAANDFIGWLGIFGYHERPTSAVAVTDCTLFKVSKEDFIKHLRQDPHALEHHLSYLERVMNHLLESLVSSGKRAA